MKHDPPNERKAGCRTCLLLGLGLCNFRIDLGLESRQAAQASIGQSARRVQPGRLLFRQGEKLESIPIVCEGWISSVAMLADGRRQIISFVLPGEFLTYAMLFDQQLQHSVLSITSACLRSFNQVEICKALLSKPEMFGRVTSELIEEKRRVERLITDLGRRSAVGRVARLILNLRDRLAERGLVQGERFEFPLRQTHIADATGLTPVHVNRVIGQLREQGVIEIENRLLSILRLQDLQLSAER